MHQFSNLFLE